MATQTITAVGYKAAWTMYIYKNTRYYKKFTIKTAAGAVVDIRGWTILFTAKTPGDLVVDTTDVTAIIKVNTVVGPADADGALGIFYLDIPDSSTNVVEQKLECDFIYISGTERYPLMKFSGKVVENVTNRESAI